MKRPARDMSPASHAGANSAHLTPARALLTPTWIASLLVLIVNDHALKGSGLLPGVVTGKLSDLAGLVVAPVLLAVLLRVRTRGGLLACFAAVGIEGCHGNPGIIHSPGSQ